MASWISHGSLLAAMLALVALVAMSGAAADSSVSKMTDYPSLLYVTTPFSVCFGALLTSRTVITDARCLFPFSNTSSVADNASGALKPDYLMVALPTVNTSATMHNILLSTQVYTTDAQAGLRATTFMGLAAGLVDNSTFYAVNTSAVHAYYPQSQDSEPAKQNFNVAILTLKVPIKGAQLASLQLDDLDADTDDLTAITFSPRSAKTDAASQQVLYQGIDLTMVQKTPVSSLKRSECNSVYMKAYGLKDMRSFQGHGLPDGSSPVYCSQMYDNTTQCQRDSDISISKSGSNINSVDLNSTIFIIPRGSSVRVVSVGRPHLFEVRSSPSKPCNSNGFVHFPRTGLYTDWIGWVTRGSVASNGSLVDKPGSGNGLDNFFDSHGVAASTPQLATMMSLLAFALAAISATL
ncbi:hypothetical protein GGI20_003196 [Coemansia sp. BCRC 34301]|nr:hypothetical protein GGI20_003196 [Coemansia sp. BCRC 34301]